MRVEIDTDKITLINEVVILDVDKDAKSFKDLGNGVKLYFDTEVAPYKIETAVQNGVVMYTPSKTKSKEMNLSIGDDAYCHHFILEPEDSEIIVAGKSMRQLAYDDIYCIYRSDTDIEMLTKWNLVEPIEEEVKTVLHFEYKDKKYVKNKGILRFKNKDLEGAEPGDTVIFTKYGDYEIMVGGKLYYRMANEDIEAIIV